MKANFALTGYLLYFEIVLWTIFDVMCSLLFNVGQVRRNTTTDPNNDKAIIDPSEIPSQIAKMLFAPFCTIIVYLGYCLLNEKSLIDLSAGKGAIVFAFIGGYYNTRLIAFLEKLKELLLPYKGKEDLHTQNGTALKNLFIKIVDIDKLISETAIIKII